jgi:hypothetical protein
MSRPLPSRVERARVQLYGQATAQYQALMHHCLGCADCRAAAPQGCPVAITLRGAWSAAEREAR